MKTLKDYFINYRLNSNMLENAQYYTGRFNACPLCNINVWSTNHGTVWFCLECTQAQAIVPLTKKERIDFYYRFIQIANIPDPCPLVRATSHHYQFYYRKKLSGYAHVTKLIKYCVYLPYFSIGQSYA